MCTQLMRSIMIDEKSGRKFRRIDAAISAINAGRLRVLAAYTDTTSDDRAGDVIGADRLQLAGEVALSMADYAGGGGTAPMSLAEAERIVLDHVLSAHEVTA